MAPVVKRLPRQQPYPLTFRVNGMAIVLSNWAVFAPPDQVAEGELSGEGSSRGGSSRGGSGNRSQSNRLVFPSHHLPPLPGAAAINPVIMTSSGII